VALTRTPAVYNKLRRPVAVARFLLRRPHQESYGIFGLMQGPGMFLDVGANAGQAAYSFRIFNRRSPILSFEPNPFHEPDLLTAARLLRRMKYRLCGASDKQGEMALFVPHYRGVPLTPYASLDREEIAESWLRHEIGDRRMASPDFVIVERRVSVCVLDDLHLQPSFIKVDVEGHELPVLTGLRGTIRRNRPVLLVETPGPDVDALLGEFGYEPFRYVAATHSVDRRGGEEDRRSPDTVFLLPEHVPRSGGPR